MQIFYNDNTIQNITEFINTNYALKKIAFFVDDNAVNQDISLQLQKQLTNKVIENKPLTEDVAFCIICGNFTFQQQSLKKITSCNLPFGYIITQLNQSSFLTNFIQQQSLQKIYSAEFIALEKQTIKKQNFACNLAVVSFLQAQNLCLFEKEFYARVFNKAYTLECKDKLIAICESLEGLMQLKLKNMQTANLKVADAVVKYLKLQTKYNFLQEENAILTFANNLTNCLFNNFYENTFIASVFATSLLQKYFALTFDNCYTFNYEKNLPYCNRDFKDNIQDFKNSVVNNDLCYKLLFNRDYFASQLNLISTKIFLNKYDFLCIFDDFGYKLVNILKKCNIKENILQVANSENENIFKQVRNVGLLDF